LTLLDSSLSFPFFSLPSLRLQHPQAITYSSVFFSLSKRLLPPVLILQTDLLACLSRFSISCDLLWVSTFGTTNAETVLSGSICHSKIQHNVGSHSIRHLFYFAFYLNGESRKISPFFRHSQKKFFGKSFWKIIPSAKSKVF
jgi:hypothetical protein